MIERALSGPAVATMAQALSQTVGVLLLVTAALAARDARGGIQGRLLALMAVSLAALEIATGPMAGALIEPVRTALRLAGVANLALVWLFCLSILRDRFRFGRLECVGAVLLVFGPLLVALAPQGVAGHWVLSAYSAAAPFAMIAHLSWVCLTERAGDLVGGRRRVRFWIPALLILAALTSVLSEEIADAPLASLVRVGLAGLPIAALLLGWLAGIDPSRLRFTASASRAEPRVDPRDTDLLARLLSVMEAGEARREPDLTIDQLARRLNTPTHRLRALINAGLGFRNFAAFTNQYRLAHAKAALADPARGRDTVLAIAFEAGFASLQTFNRVFRQTEGVTPSDYRTRALDHLQD